MRVVRFFLLLFAILFAGNAFAHSSEITLYAGGFLGDSFVIRPPTLFDEVEAVLDDDVTVGIRYAYYFHPRFALEGGLGFTPATIVSRGSVSGGTSVAAIFDVDTYVMHANLLFRMAQGPVVPYLTAGVGAVHFDINTASFGFLTPSETDFAVNAGGGLKLRIRGETTYLRIDGRVYWLDPEFSEEDTATFGEITGGVSILFDF